METNNSEETVQNYQKFYTSYQEKKEELIKVRVELSEAQDTKRRLEKEKQIEEEHIQRIDEEISNSNQNKIVRYQNEIDTSQAKISQYERNIRKNKKDRSQFSVKERCLLDTLIGAMGGSGISAILILACPETTPIIIGALIGTGMIACPVIGCTRATFKNHSKKNLSQKIAKEKQKLLTLSQQIKEEFTSNPELINRKCELEREKEEALNKIDKLSQKISTLTNEISHKQQIADTIQNEIDELFYMLSVSEAKLLLQGENVEQIIENQPVKKLG